MKLELSRAAEAELFAARDFYEREREGLGQDFVDEMEAVMARILANPLQFTQIRRSKSRRALGRRFPYKIIQGRGASERQNRLEATRHNA
ncbi:MAG: type II toxin-antitoxin system RelE/ParE family toxin [Phycisphaerae bacterium]|nr:type II toxin-antitoxin system RelE/ParE family toxin [Phycisphaerae bacterium]